MEPATCKTCGGTADGYKCDMCGTEANEHDAAHSCGGDHCMPKCAACSQAETKCACTDTDSADIK